MDLSMANPDVHYLIVVCVCIFVFGGLGGVSGGLYRYKCNHFPCIDHWRDFLIFTLSGIVCAFGVIVLCTGIGAVFDRSNVFSQGLYIIGISLVSGFFAMRLLPSLGNRLEKQINDATRKAVKAEEQGKMAVEYNQLVSIATTALTTKNQADMDYAIDCLEKDISSFYWDRTLNIYLGRLYRWQGNLDKAIMALRTFIQEKYKHKTDKSSVDKEALGVAYFNIACYHTLKVKQVPEEKKRLLNEAEEALLNAIELIPNLKEEISSDSDLLVFRTERPDFLRKMDSNN